MIWAKPVDEIYSFVVATLFGHLVGIVGSQSCPAQRIVFFDDLATSTRTDIYCATTNPSVTQITDCQFADCSRD